MFEPIVFNLTTYLRIFVDMLPFCSESQSYSFDFWLEPSAASVFNLVGGNGTAALLRCDVHLVTALANILACTEIKSIVSATTISFESLE